MAEHRVYVEAIWQTDRTAAVGLTCECGWSWESVEDHEESTQDPPVPLFEIVQVVMAHTIASLLMDAGVAAPVPDDP